jgi:hypothetical protein
MAHQQRTASHVSCIGLGHSVVKIQTNGVKWSLKLNTQYHTPKRSKYTPNMTREGGK